MQKCHLLNKLFLSAWVCVCVCVCVCSCEVPHEGGIEMAIDN